MKHELVYRCRACEMESTEIWNDLPSNVKTMNPKVKFHNCTIFEKEKGFGPVQGLMELIHMREVQE